MNDSYVRGFLIGKEIMNMFVPKKQQPIAYLYNGVRLPALPEFDGYAHMVVHKIGDTFYMRAYENKPTTTLYKPIFYPAYDRLVADGEWHSAHMEESEAGDYWFTHSEPSDDSKGAVLAIAEIVWANFDVLNSDGTLYLAASDPIPIYNEPVNYLYNGVKLPKLPEWDREVYPYAYITVGAVTKKYSLILFSEIEYGANSNGYYSLNIPAGAGMTCSRSSDQWEEPTLLTESKTITIPNSAWIWANFDVLNSDETVYLSASEPVPIYE